MFKENKKTIYIFMSVTFLLVMFLAGYAIKPNNNKKLQRDLDAEYQKMEEDLNDKRKTLQAKATNDNIITIASNISYNTKFSKCGHEIVKNEKPDQNMVGLDRKLFEEYVKQNLSDWKINIFSREEISLSNEKNILCPNHFIVGEEDGKMAIFTIDENGDRVLHKIFKDTTTSTIRQENQKRLKQGIVVDSEEEAIQVLEDFIS